MLFHLPPFGPDDKTECLGKLSELEQQTFEPVGRWYESYCSRWHHKHALSTSSQSSDSEEEEEDSDVIENDDSILLTLDPKNWKEQDHYAVLGLGKLRNKASEDLIKRAYKKKVLQHHPDKRRAPVKRGEEDYFTCATKAYEILGNPVKRRSYDSVDPQFDDSIPPNNSESKQNFFKLFAPVFERNARWSIKTEGMPSVGDESTPFKQVDSFYNFWYSFESWREYSYLDEEEKKNGENRDERRWIEKQNKASRLKMKKEEAQRIRQLVDNAYACDPRIIKYKTEEKEKKIADKKAKQDAVRMKAEVEERKRLEALEVERIAKEKEEEELKAQQAAQRKEKEQQKKNLKKEKKRLRTFAKDWDFLANDEQERIQNMQDFDKLTELLSIESLVNLNEFAATGDKEKFSQQFKSKLDELNQGLENENRRQVEVVSKKNQGGGAAENAAAKDDWTNQEIYTLIKAVNLFPAGTNARWETIANFLKLHVPDCTRSAKEALSKAKDLQKNDANLKEDINKKAYENFLHDKGSVSVNVTEISERSEADEYDAASNTTPWSADEQKLLEQAMRTFPASVAERWEKIAECIKTRTKKDCMKRYKELVELIRIKKLAQAATTGNKK